MRHPHALLASLTVLALTACSGQEARPDHAAQPNSTPTASVFVGLVEWDVVISAPVLKQGPVTMVVTNAGTTAHDLRIASPAVEEAVSLLHPGQQASLHLDLAGAQELMLWCTIAGHRAQGMRGRLEVTSQAG